VNIQVNNYGGMSKEEIIAKLTGKPVEPKQIASAPAQVDLGEVLPDKLPADTDDLTDPLLRQPGEAEVLDAAPGDRRL
jgi:hypothetical protein